MNLLVTGSNGFLGRHVVHAAIRRGHHVRAQVRPATAELPNDWHGHPMLETARCDLRSRQDLIPLVEGVDGVIHLAAAKAGDLYEQFASTVVATENLLEAMKATGVRRMALASSLSVYEYLGVRSWRELGESTALAKRPEWRDEYCQTKLIQETLVRETASEENWRCVVLRPGVIFGRGNLWCGRLGVRINNRWWIRIGTCAPLPLTYVENCSEAIVLGAEYEGPERELVVNVIDDKPPSQRAYLRQLQRLLAPSPHIIPVPWTIMRTLARVAWSTNQRLFRGGVRLPGMLIPARLHARSKPLRYSNNVAKAKLGWIPQYTWREGIGRALSDYPLATLPSIERSPTSWVQRSMERVPR